MATWALAGRIVALILVLAGCGPGNPGASPGTATPTGSSSGARDLTVFAAASLKSVLDEARGAWAATPGGTGLTISTDSSATLAAQIELGAPADVFLSADSANPARLAGKGMADGSAVAFASNKLTIVVPAGNPAGIRTPADLARPGVRIIAAGDSVPISRYAAQVVERLATHSGAPAGFAAAYAANVRSKEDNVRAVLAKLELGEGDAAIVYVTDAASSARVARIDIPDAANVPATYAAIVVKGNPAVTEARAFLSWLVGPAGQAILARHGFLPPD